MYLLWRLVLQFFLYINIKKANRKNNYCTVIQYIYFLIRYYRFLNNKTDLPLFGSGVTHFAENGAGLSQVSELSAPLQRPRNLRGVFKILLQKSRYYNAKIQSNHAPNYLTFFLLLSSSCSLNTKCTKPFFLNVVLFSIIRRFLHDTLNETSNDILIRIIYVTTATL